jgi:hypothetical protein
MPGPQPPGMLLWPLVAIVAPIPIEIARAVPIPAMVVVKAAPVTFPVALKELATLVARSNPTGSAVGWAAPISVMPAVSAAYRIPIAVYPKVIRPRRAWTGMNHPRGRRRPDSYANRQLCKTRSPCQKQHR